MKSSKIKIKDRKGPAKYLAEPLQGTATIADNRMGAVYQRKLHETMNHQRISYPRLSKRNDGLPAQLKFGIENLSGYAMDDVKVHYNSHKPAQLNAHAFAHGTNIHLAPGQEKHLPHEAWHVVQQKQGRVKPTLQLRSNLKINDDAGLEREADLMGDKAIQRKGQVSKSDNIQNKDTRNNHQIAALSKVIQCQRIKKTVGARVGLEIETSLPVRRSKSERVTYKGKKYEEKEIHVLDKHKNAMHLISLLNGLDNSEQGEINQEESKKVKALMAVLNLTNSQVGPSIINHLDGKAADIPLKQCIGRIQSAFLGVFDVPIGKLLHQGKGWQAVSEKVPMTVEGYRNGHLASNMGVEIVTDPVKSKQQADDIMDDIEQWLKPVYSTKSFEVGAFTYEIPEHDKIAENYLKGGQLKGNIQVNIGATLEDVIDVFHTNLEDVKDPDDKKFLTDILADFGSDEFWKSVKAEFNAFRWTNPLMAKKKQKFSNQTNYKERKRLKKYDDFTINPEDEPFLRNIMFQHIYQLAADLRKMTDESSPKNKFPILLKTPVEIQTNLSAWKNREKIWGIKDKLDDHQKAFRTRFTEAIFLAISSSGKHKSLLKQIRSLIQILQGLAADKQYDFNNNITNPEHLAIENDKHAGVFEIRYLQNNTYKQTEWLGLWHSYLLDYPDKKNVKKFNTVGILKAGEKHKNTMNEILNSLNKD
ncbi:MAG: DUF4157 domain-containing protein [Bacteroidota bacterium]